MRRSLSQRQVQDLAVSLSRLVTPFAPQLVVYLERGGKTAGLAMAGQLGTRAIGMDLSYPFSRLDGPWAVLLWPLKELFYRLTSPRPNRNFDKLEDQRLVLVDDSASSGRSINLAVKTLVQAGISRQNIRIATIRCGTGAREIVDFFEIEERVLFID